MCTSSRARGPPWWVGPHRKFLAALRGHLRMERARLGALVAHLAAGGAETAVEEQVSTLEEQLQDLASEALIQPGHDLGRLGTREAGKEIVVVGGRGACVITSDGREMIDGPGGIWNVQMGYGQQSIIDAITTQLTILLGLDP